MLQRMRGQRGEGQGGCIVGLIVLLVALFIAWKIIPVKVRSAELRQTVVDQARSAAMREDRSIRHAILTKARNLNLPVTDKDVKVRRANNAIYVEVEYVVPIEFPGYTYQYKHRHVAENPLF